MEWRRARVTSVTEETPSATTIVLEPPAGWPGHTAGQHVDVRLTAETGYQTERAYAIASAPEDAKLALTVERIAEGEVSPYLTGGLRAGDELELRGPIGGSFTWRVADGGPLLLVADGVGLVPLMAMLRHRAARACTVDARLLASARSLADALYRDELERLSQGEGLTVYHSFTPEPPADWSGFARPVDADMLRMVGPSAARRPRAFLSGSTAFVGRVADQLEALGHTPAAIRAEDFGPTAG